MFFKKLGNKFFVAMWLKIKVINNYKNLHNKSLVFLKKTNEMTVGWLFFFEFLANGINQKKFNLLGSRI